MGLIIYQYLLQTQALQRVRPQLCAPANTHAAVKHHLDPDQVAGVLRHFPRPSNTLVTESIREPPATKSLTSVPDDIAALRRKLDTSRLFLDAIACHNENII